MSDRYLDYLTGQQLALARQEDEIIALRGRLQGARETYEAFLESNSPVIAGLGQEEARQGEEVIAAASRCSQSPSRQRESETAVSFSAEALPQPDLPTMPDAASEDYWRANASRITSTGEQEKANGSVHSEARVPTTGEPSDATAHSNDQRGSEEEAAAQSALGAERNREPVPKSPASEAQPTGEPDGLELPAFLRRVPA